MTRLNWLIAPFSALTLCLTFSSVARACALFEEPLSLNTQTFRLASPNGSNSGESLEPEPSSNKSSKIPASDLSDSYGAAPLPVEPRQVVFIGNQPNRMFQVVVTDTRRETLAALRLCVLDAFATQTRLGRYIQVGSFTHRSEAELISRKLEKAGYPVRVIHIGNIDASATASEGTTIFP